MNEYGSTTTTWELSKLRLHANASSSSSEWEPAAAAAAEPAQWISTDIDFAFNEADANPDATTSASADH